MTRDTLSFVNLSSADYGAAVVATNDEFFAPAERMLRSDAPVFIPDKYVPTGKWMDGWESRRRRSPGHDWCLIRLGSRGVIVHALVDTTHFRGNYAEEFILEGCDMSGHPGQEELEGADAHWIELLPKSRLEGNGENWFDLEGAPPVTHVRLRIFPDGGVARLRLWGKGLPDWDRLDFGGGLADLAAAQNGGRILAVSDMFFGAAQNLIFPGRPHDMSGGWETRRRRGPGHDWAVLELGERGRITEAEVDTLHFRGNAPGKVAIDVCDRPGAKADNLADSDWTELLPPAAVQPHALHRFSELADAGHATHARLRIYPDGGVARLRLLGRSERSEKLIAGLGKFNHGAASDVEEALYRSCGSRDWAKAMAAARPLSSVASMFATADRLWSSLSPEAWKEAFAAHPRIGERKASGWSAKEQAGVDAASESTLTELTEKNEAYEQRFGFVFLICATGKSADEMLSALRKRLDNSPEEELANAAEEQRKITHLRLVKWILE